MTYERSIVSNFESCGANVPESLARAADVADVTRGWGYEAWETTYQAQQLSEYDRQAIGEYGAGSLDAISSAILAECAAWARSVGRKILEDRDATLLARITRFVALHDPVLSEDEIAAALKVGL